MTQIEYNRKIMEKEKRKRMSEIDDEASLASTKAQADAEFYKTEKETDANRVRESVLLCNHKLNYQLV